ncbi:MAG TPA: hypothetical protein VGE41_03565 [Verrucomicrobiae bacterium]
MNMPIEKIESLLRQAPRPAAAEGLLARLDAEIRLPQRHASRSTAHSGPSFFRRWIPALSLALWLLASVIILAIETGAVRELRRENEKLKAELAQRNSAALPGVGTETRQLDQFQSEKGEIEKLLLTVADLNRSLQDMQRVQRENMAQAQGAAANANGPAETRDYFDVASEREDRLECVQRLKQVGLAMRMWANDHGDVFPNDYQSLSNELVRMELTTCPRDNKSVFEFVSPGGNEVDPWVVLTHCAFHHNVGLSDGSVQQIGTNKHIVTRADGKKVIGGP